MTRPGDAREPGSPVPIPNDVAPAVADLETIVSLSKRRGFVFPSSEIYGGINAVWDYGPLGVELKNNVKRAWWRAMVQERDDIVGLDAGILMHPQVWVTSGHVGSSAIRWSSAQTAHKRFRVDELPGAEEPRPRPICSTRRSSIASGLRCPERRWSAVGAAPVQPDAQDVHRTGRGRRRGRLSAPETAQGIYVNFKNVLAVLAEEAAVRDRPDRQVVPQRDQPGQLRVPDARVRADGDAVLRPARRRAAAAFDDWLPRRRAWYERYGVSPDRLRFREHAPDELAHYAKKAVDVEYRFPFGWKELEGIHNRGDFDLAQPRPGSGETSSTSTRRRRSTSLPWIVETSAGGDRAPLHLPDRRLPRGGGPGREARLPGAPSRPRPVQGRRPATAQEAARDRRAVPQDQGRSPAPHDGRVRRHGRDRQALPPAG